MFADRSDRWLETLLAFYEQHWSCRKVMSERYVDRLESRCFAEIHGSGDEADPADARQKHARRGRRPMGRVTRHELGHAR